MNRGSIIPPCKQIFSNLFFFFCKRHPKTSYTQFIWRKIRQKKKKPKENSKQKLISFFFTAIQSFIATMVIFPITVVCRSLLPIKEVRENREITAVIILYYCSLSLILPRNRTEQDLDKLQLHKKFWRVQYRQSWRTDPRVACVVLSRRNLQLASLGSTTLDG